MNIKKNQSRSTTFYHYAYGADGVNGAWVRYSNQTCNKEYVKTKLSKKTASSNWFWQKLSEGKLYSVGDEWAYSGTTEWWKYKLRVRFKRQCSGTFGYEMAWLL